MALTGVGPSIASGSQTCSGNWADLPIVPANSSSPANPATESPTMYDGCSARLANTAGSNSSRNDNVPVREYTYAMPSSISTSPTRVVMNALMAAWNGVIRLGSPYVRANQKPMSKYEHRPMT